jgi:hypothetical protein
MDSPKIKWQLTGNYFENCNCDVVCPCLFSTLPPLTSKPTNGDCKLGIAFHVDRGAYGKVALDSLNAVLMIHTPGVMADGNWSVAVYLDSRANDQQREALQAIFTGAAGGPVATLAPLISKVLGVKTAPIIYASVDKKRSVEISGVLKMAVHATPSIVPDKEIWATNAHPFATEGLAMAVGDQGSTFEDYGMRWDNSGKNGHYAPIKWSNK